MTASAHISLLKSIEEIETRCDLEFLVTGLGEQQVTRICNGPLILMPLRISLPPKHHSADQPKMHLIPPSSVPDTQSLIA